MGKLTKSLVGKRILLIDLDRLKLNQVNNYLSRNGIKNTTIATSISASKEHLLNSEFDNIFIGVDKDKTGLTAYVTNELVVRPPPFQELEELIKEMNEEEDDAYEDLLGLTSQAFLQDDIDSLFMNANFINAQFQEINLDLKVLEVNDDSILLSTAHYREDGARLLTLCLDYNVNGNLGELKISGMIAGVEEIQETQTLKFLPAPNCLNAFESFKKIRSNV